MLKTKQQWDESGLSLSYFLSIGDEVDEGIYYYFMEVLPPRLNRERVLLMGEPYSEKDGQNTYMALTKETGVWRYSGVLTVEEARCLKYV